MGGHFSLTHPDDGVGRYATFDLFPLALLPAASNGASDAQRHPREKPFFREYWSLRPLTARLHADVLAIDGTPLALKGLDGGRVAGINTLNL